MSIKNRGRMLSWFLVFVVGGGAIVALNWKWLTFGAAVALAERRPALLADAQWNDPTTARAFLARFPSGSSESELIEWLTGNDFAIDQGSGRATRLISSLPCNERVQVDWTRMSENLIEKAEARVTEAGCL